MEKHLENCLKKKEKEKKKTTKKKWFAKKESNPYISIRIDIFRSFT